MNPGECCGLAGPVCPSLRAGAAALCSQLGCWILGVAVFLWCCSGRNLREQDLGWSFLTGLWTPTSCFRLPSLCSGAALAVPAPCPCCVSA